MFAKLFLVVVCFVCCSFTGASAQTVPVLPVAGLGAAEFSIDTNGTKDFIWRRPPEVEFVFLSGCGGGGNGHQGDVNGLVHAGGGRSSTYQTVLVKVSGDTYKITLGSGGENTVFAGEGVTITFKAGEIGISSKVLLNGVVQGIDRDSTGEASPFGAGAEASTNENGHGRDASAKCAGGGGGMHEGTSGRGGPGFLSIQPLPDLARFARVLGIIEKLSQSTPDSPGLNEIDPAISEPTPQNQ